MTTASPVEYASNRERRLAFIKGFIAMLPLSVAALPWAILTGSIALETGFTPLQSQGLSTIIFGGAVQLGIMGLIPTGAGLLSILITAFLITSRHFLYSMVMRDRIKTLPVRWRLGLGFVLTDELFALANPDRMPHFDRWYALGCGLSFYVAWIVGALVGVLAGQYFDDLNSYGLDFAIAATFIALVIPLVKNAACLVCVVVSIVATTLCELFAVPAALMVSAPISMLAGFAYHKFTHNDAACQEC